MAIIKGTTNTGGSCKITPEYLEENYYDKNGADGKFLEKISLANRVYVTDGNGNQATLAFDTFNANNTVPVRSPNGTIRVSTPLIDKDATTKKYVDDKFKLPENETNLLNIPNVNATTLRGITYSIKNGIITYSGKAESQYNNMLSAQIILDKGTYFFTQFSSTYFARIRIYKGVNFTDVFNSSFIIDDSVTLIEYHFQLDNRTAITFVNEKSFPMIVKGSTAPTKYYPYNDSLTYKGDVLELLEPLENNLDKVVTEVKEIAEGKSNRFVIKSLSNITGQKDEDGNFTNVTAITGVDLTKLAIGDVILIEDLEVPDYWVKQITPSISLSILETTKVEVIDAYSKEESDGKYVGKITATNRIYGTDGNGNQVTIGFSSEEANEWSIVRRTSGGAIKTGAPIKNEDATPKSYVDDLVIAQIVNLPSQANTYKLENNKVYVASYQVETFSPTFDSNIDYAYCSDLIVMSGEIPIQLELSENVTYSGFDCEGGNFYSMPYTTYRFTFTKGLNGMNIIVARG